MSRSASDSLCRCERGAAAVEFALVVGLAIMLIIGTVQLGRVMMARSDMSHALAQAVRIVHLDPATPPEAIVAALAERLDSYAETDLEVEVTEISGTSYMRIAVRFPFPFAIPFVPERSVLLRVETFAPRVSPAQFDAG